MQETKLPNIEEVKWSQVVDMLQVPAWNIEESNFQSFLASPSELVTDLAYYKFAYRMIPANSSILKIGEGSPIGFQILMEDASESTLLAADKALQSKMKSNLKDGKYTILSESEFDSENFSNQFDAIVNFDNPNETKLNNIFASIVKVSLKQNGIFIVMSDEKGVLEFLKSHFKVVFLFKNDKGVLQSCRDNDNDAQLFMCCTMK